MPRAPVPSLTLELRDERVIALLGDHLGCSVWEVLRRFGRAASTDELAVAMEADKQAVQAAIDALVSLKLVVRAVAAPGQGVGRIRYRAAASGIVVVFDDQDSARMAEPGHVGHAGHAGPSFGFGGAAHLGRVSLFKRAGRQESAYRYAKPVRLDATQFIRLRALLEEARNLLEQAASASSIDADGSGVFCTHQVLLEVHPCPAGTLPLPEIVLTPRSVAQQAHASVGGSGMRVLSVRERTVALALAAGKSRPAIAVELGLSVNTVATVSKRIYAKLRVRNRAALANHLRG